MHNLTKIRIFRILLALSWVPSILLLYPFAFLRRKLSARHIFVFDRYGLGGAQKVHIDILNSISEESKLVLFTRYSPDDVMRAAFESVPNTKCQDIHFWCDNLLFRLFAIHYWVFYLNRHRHLKLLSANSTFFYDLLPWLSKAFVRMELLHNFTYGPKGMEHFGFANYRYLDKRLVVDSFTAENVRNQYDASEIDESFKARIQIIEPGVEIPAQIPQKEKHPLKVLYAGRGGPQKRVWLIDRIASHCYKEGWPVVFHFAGNVDSELSSSVKSQSIMHGQVSDPAQMKLIYEQSHVIILTSAYEGFPMVIKEGMAQGCIPLVTALPGNKTHLQHDKNALLIEHINDEDLLVAEGISLVAHIISDPTMRITLMNAAFSYAQQHFSRQQFVAGYRAILAD